MITPVMMIDLTDSTAPRQVEVLLPLNVPGGFDYLLPPSSQATQGMWVRVPFGKKQIIGIIRRMESHSLDSAKCKFVSHLYTDLPPLSDAMLRYLEWVAWYNKAAPGPVLKLTACLPEAVSDAPMEEVFSLADPLPEIKLTASRNAVFDCFETDEFLSAAIILERSGASRSVLSGLKKAGAILRHTRPQITAPPSLNCQRPVLSNAQMKAANLLAERTGEGFSVSLLEGVTGSGKTEVYFDMIEHVLTQEKQVLVLLPEIALSVQWVQRFKQRFGFAPDIWHSVISKGARKRIWRNVASGVSRLVVGARSALFLPYADPGLIVVDEEHDPSYKQEEGVIYHARDMAVARAKHEAIPIVLASATPSLETVHNVNEGRYQHVKLPTRYGKAQLPQVTLIDMCAEKLPATEFLSGPLKEAIASQLDKGEQSLLFLNRRGYAPLLLCRSCGYRLECPNCTSWLVWHKQWRRLQCHHCDTILPEPTECPSCHAKETLAACGPGVERIHEEVANAFPDASIATLTSDNITGRQDMERSIHQISEGNIDLIIGTQLLAKGHHFPLLTLIGVVDADMGLKGGDLRAMERTYQLLHQLSGRAGREHLAGQVMIQTFQPGHPVMQALESGDRDSLLKLEMQSRRSSGMPPFGRLAAIILEGKQEASLKQIAQWMAQHIPTQEGLQVWGPTPAPLYRLREYYRYRFLIKGAKQTAIQSFIHQWLSHMRLPSGIKCKIDIDPQSFL